MLYLDDDGPFRLKSFSSSTKGTKGVIRIEIECDDLRRLGYELGNLAEIEAKQRAADAAKKAGRTPQRKVTAKSLGADAPLLALPAPQAALPAPKVR